MRIAAMFIAVCLAATTSAAQPVKQEQDGDVTTNETSSGVVGYRSGVAWGLEWQPPTQRGGGGGRVLLWSGLVLAAGGVTFSALSNNVLATQGDSVFCNSPFVCPGGRAAVGTTYTEPSEQNAAVLWGGAALAVVGATMAIVGKARGRESVAFVPMRGGGAVFRRIEF